MERQIEDTVEAALSRQPILCEFVLKNLSADRIVGLLKAALLDAAPGEAPQIENLIQLIFRLRTERNNILHRTWLTGLAPDTAIAASNRPFRQFQWSELNADQIRDTANEMGDTVGYLLKWQAFLRKPPAPPSP